MRRTQECFGCTDRKLADHLESLFTDGMSWGNVGAWEIDHNVPLAAGDTEEEVLTLSHWANLQPMWKADNRRKNAAPPASLVNVLLPMTPADRAVRAKHAKLLARIVDSPTAIRAPRRPT